MNTSATPFVECGQTHAGVAVTDIAISTLLPDTQLIFGNE